jgi:hypothetical protein
MSLGNKEGGKNSPALYRSDDTLLVESGCFKDDGEQYVQLASFKIKEFCLVKDTINKGITN